MSTEEIIIYTCICYLVVRLLKSRKKCPKCKAKLYDNYYIPGFEDSHYWKCPKCNHKE